MNQTLSSITAATKARGYLALAVLVVGLLSPTLAHAGTTVGTGGEDGMTFAQCGYASYYGLGVMERVARDLKRDGCTYCVGIIATIEWRWLGMDVWVWYPGVGGTVGPFRVVDVAGAVHQPGLRARQRVFELPYPWALAVRMGKPTWACFGPGR